jgi:hypothetical protein
MGEKDSCIPTMNEHTLVDLNSYGRKQLHWQGCGIDN